jgi:hypothetical protein
MAEIKVEDDVISRVVVEKNKDDIPSVLIEFAGSWHRIKIIPDCDGIHLYHMVPNDDWSEYNFMEDPHIPKEIANISYETLEFVFKDEETE